MTDLAAPPEWASELDRGVLNALRFDYGREYDIEFDGHIWTAAYHADGTILRADASRTLRQQIIGHHPDLKPGPGPHC